MTGAADRLGLGTVQFGLAYGITNGAGRVRDAEVGSILRSAAAAGIRTLDTAHLYGDSEQVLGRHRAVAAAFRVVTKTPKFGETDSAEAACTLLRSAFRESLAKLGAAAVYGLLLHNAEDLLGPFGEVLWDEMVGLKQAGFVAKIGLSVYDGEQVDAALAHFPIDLVQIPFNPLDRRLIESGQLARLAAAGVEVHARSILLQGLLLQGSEQLPPHLYGLAQLLDEMHAAFEAQGLSRLEGILASCLRETAISTFLCGVTTVAELQDIVFAAEKAHSVQCNIDFVGSHRPDPRLLNPACWPELAQRS